MAYQHKNSKGVTYYLNTKEVTLKGGQHKVSIYYFTKDYRPETACDLPENRMVVESTKNGFLVLKSEV